MIVPSKESLYTKVGYRQKILLTVWIIRIIVLISIRLHFHGIFYVPDGAMSGKLEEVRDYDTRAKRMRTIQQNTFFAERFGRNEFRPIHHSSELPQMVQYLMKYIEKSSDREVIARLPKVT